MSTRSKFIAICLLLITSLIYTNYRMTERSSTIPYYSLSIPTTDHYISLTQTPPSSLATNSSTIPETTTSLKPVSTLQMPVETFTSHKIDPDEKYLTFLTHSGFQNQLIQVENGILLAWYLNRTLILPKALLGKAFGWSYFPKLLLEHQLRNMDTTEDCDEYTNEMNQWNITCPNRDRYAMVSFNEIFNLSWAKQHVKIITRERVDNDWLRTRLGIYTEQQNVSNTGPNYGTYIDGDILYYRGGTRYDYRIFDTPRKSQRLGKYAEALNIYDLRQRDEKLIHFSSLFGSGRLPIRRPEHYAFLRSLQKSITYRHPAVLKMTDLIVDTLGGHGNFIGIHIRSGDGWFVNALPDNLGHIVSRIHHAAAQQQKHQRYQQTLLDSGLDTTQPLYTNLSQCVAAAKNGNTTLIFVATDARNPRSSPVFDPLWNAFPCSFTIHDILAQRDGLDDQTDFGIDYRDDQGAAGAADTIGWAILDKVRNPVTGTTMRPFLLPLVDASISSRGWIFIGSKGSTFSGYIHRLHDIYWSTAKKPGLAIG